MKNINLEKFMQAQWNLTKLWRTLATVLGVIILVLDTLIVFTNQLNGLLAISGVILAIMNSIFIWHSDNMKREAETLLRKYEMAKSLGWSISSREIANLLASAPQAAKKAALSNEEYQYFTSQESVGARRLLENLEESAWWSKHLAKRMSIYVGAASIGMLALAFITLFVALQTPVSATTALIARAIMAIVVFVFSGDYLRLAFDYNSFSMQAFKTEEEAYRLQRQESIPEPEAIKLLHDYQIDRATSPLLPTWLWQVSNKELNELWAQRIRE